jgi:hypothetical protein
MNNQNDSKELVERPNYDLQLRQFETGLLNFLSRYGLPTESIFVPIEERVNVFKNIESVLTKINEEQKESSVYVSKFTAATASGLFDAALNYLWDETILELRHRVTQYDLSFFYDNAVSSPDRRKDLSDASDLTKLSDSELIQGAKEIGLISELGFKHLDYIRYMRNWVSAAHPNQNEITGLQLISWLETCIKEVISLPLSNVSVEIKKLLYNIKNTSVTANEAKQIATIFIKLTSDQVNSLASGLFGIYCRPETSSQTRQNITHLLPSLWDKIDEPTRQQFGIKYGKFVINNDKEEKKLARQFLQIVSAESYIPDDLRATEIKIAIDNLLGAHRQINNFYNEPPFARELQRLVGDAGNVPKQVYKPYVLGLVEVFLTNGNGIAFYAEPVYKKLLDLFDQRQALIAICSFIDTNIASRLQFLLCQEKYRELLDMMGSKVSAPVIQEFINELKEYKGPLDKVREDLVIKRHLAAVQKILT